jgi:hypothetical protein
MSRLIFAASAAFLTAILPLAAQAADQSPPDGSAVVQSSPSTASQTPTGSAETSMPRAPLGSAANPAPVDYPVPASQADKLLPADPGVVTNGPVPDTSANRAKDGRPLSNAGRTSQAAGN